MSREESVSRHARSQYHVTRRVCIMSRDTEGPLPMGRKTVRLLRVTMGAMTQHRHITGNSSQE